MDTEKKSKLLFYAFTALSILAIVTCFIVNLFATRRLTWSLYPFIGIILVWIVALPFFFVESINKKILFSLISFSVLILPFLFTLQFLTPIGKWFMPLGLPIGIILIACIWISYILVWKLKDKWALSGALTFLYVVCAGTLINFLVGRFSGSGFVNLQLLINLISGLAITFLLFFIAYSKRKSDNVPKN